jgi:hypothetical protein
MIKINIERITTTTVMVSKNFMTHTEGQVDTQGAPIYEDTDYSSHPRKVVRKEDYKVEQVPEERVVRVTLLQQEIPEDSDFDLAAVIAAINNLSLSFSGGKKITGG